MHCSQAFFADACEPAKSSENSVTWNTSLAILLHLLYHYQD